MSDAGNNEKRLRPAIPAEEALRDSEERFRLLTQCVEDYAIFLMDSAGNVASWNEGAQRILGYAAEEVLGGPASIFFTEEDQRMGRAERELETASKVGKATDENWLRRKDGSRFWASGTTTLLRDPAGGIKGFVKIFRDLTQHKATEERLRESEERLRVALAAAQMGTWLWRIPTNEFLLDDSLRNLLGAPAGAVPRDLEGFLQFVHEGDRDRVRAEFERSLRQGGGFEVEFRTARPDGGTRWLADQGRTFLGPDGRPVFMTGAAIDVTARRNMEEERRQARDELEERVRQRTAELEAAQRQVLQSERLAAVGQMVAGLAHESRNALQRGHACLTVLGLRLRGQPELLDLVARAQKAQDDLHWLYEDVREYAAPLLLDTAPCDLRTVWREAWDNLESARRDRPAALHEEVCGEAVCEGSPFHLRQVFRNLMDNALGAAEGPAEVTVRCSPDPDQPDTVRIVVEDNGPGFTAEQRRRAFEPFFTTKLHGTGLGLAICRRIIEAHSGRIQLDERDRTGTRVAITLPRRRA